jgi:hypothetical protein
MLSEGKSRQSEGQQGLIYFFGLGVPRDGIRRLALHNGRKLLFLL